MKTLRTFAVIATALSLLVGAAGCAAEATPIDVPAEDASISSRVTADEARSTAETALAGFNDGDYARFSTRWAASLRDGINESTFREFRKAKMEAVGRFVAIDEMRLTPAQTPGHVRFVFRCTFEKGEQVLAHIYPADGTEVTGALLGAP